MCRLELYEYTSCFQGRNDEPPVVRRRDLPAAAGCGRCANPVDKGHLSTIGYNQFIRPILSDNYSYCHGPDKNHRQAELRLDVRETAVEKGAIVPGKPDASELIRRIFNSSDDERMPPPQTNKHLTDQQKQLLKTWIAQGPSMNRSGPTSRPCGRRRLR